MPDFSQAWRTLEVEGVAYRYVSLAELERLGLPVSRLPYSLRILLENLVRRLGRRGVDEADVEAISGFARGETVAREISFLPARVLMQDFTGVPGVVDLAAMRDAIVELGGDARRVNPLLPVDLVIDHSVQVDAFGVPDAARINAEKEFERNRERYSFLKWGQSAFDNFRVVPPDTGIVHQVNLEFLAEVVRIDASQAGGPALVFDTLVGTDSHTTMINGLGVLGWGVGGIEAEAAMLGQPISMLVPKVVGFRLTGKPREGVTATDLVLTVTERLRRHGVVGKFVEFFGPGVAELSLADRATIANMAPEYGATCGLFPVDEETLRYLELSGRPSQVVERVRRYFEAQGLLGGAGDSEPTYSEVLELDLGEVGPSLAGPRRPQDRIDLDRMPETFDEALPSLLPAGHTPERKSVEIEIGGERIELSDGAVAIAAITSCTNTSNPSVLIAAGLLARNARRRGLRPPAYVKTSLAPGSRVVERYLREAGLLEDLEALRFHVVGFGCTTCIGNSGPLPEPVARAVQDEGLVVASVLSGNRNFEGRIHPLVRANYLASPPLVVAYALAGRVDIDLTSEPIGRDPDGRPVYLKDIWPSGREVGDAVRRFVRRSLFEEAYRDVFEGTEEWRSLEAPRGERYPWDPASTYVRRPPFFEGMGPEPEEVADIEGARALLLLGDSVTTDHISPAGSIPPDSPAGRYLIERGVPPEEFNSYGARRGNHEVMMRGTFANVRIRNLLVPGVEGGFTIHLPDGERMTVFDAAMRYREEGVPLVVVAGAEYGTGSSRDWAAKGPALLGVRAVIAVSFERIHRSNLVGMGILPLEFEEGQSADTLGITGREVFSVRGVAEALETPGEGRRATVTVRSDEGRERSFPVRVRVDTPQERDYFRHGGILRYVLRELAGST